MGRVPWVTCLFLSEDDEDLAAKAARLQAVGVTPLASSLNLDLGLVCYVGGHPSLDAPQPGRADRVRGAGLGLLASKGTRRRAFGCP